MEQNQAILDALGLGHERQVVGVTIRLRPNQLPHVVLHKVVIDSDGVTQLRKEFVLVETNRSERLIDKSAS